MTASDIPGFDIIEKIAEGGMATVYKARQVSLDRVVALKVLHPHQALEPTDIERFKLEAHTAAQLAHPGIVQVYDAGESGGSYFFAMQYIAGYSVSDWVDRKGPLPERQVLLIAESVAQALEYAWKKAGIIHRDIKPENLLIDEDGTIKVTDLGLLKLAGGDSSLTLRGSSFCTPNYCSPEQAKGELTLDFRSDIYSLGATLYFALTGRMPFGDIEGTGPIVQQVTGILQDPRRIVRDIGPGTAVLLRKMMAKHPGHRYADWAELLEDIRRVLKGAGPLRPLDPTAASTIEYVKTGAARKEARPHPAPKAAAAHPRPPAPRKARTARRPAARHRATPSRKPPAARTGPSPALIAALVLGVIIVVGLILGAAGRARTGARVRPAAVRSAAPPPALQEARQYAREHPEDTDGAIRRYREAAWKTAGTRFHSAAQKELDALRETQAPAKEPARLPRPLKRPEPDIMRGGPEPAPPDEADAAAEAPSQDRPKPGPPAELRALTDQYRRGVDTLEAVYTAERQGVADKYAAALEKLAEGFKAQGDLDAVLAVEKEQARFREVEGWTPDAPDAAPEPLRNLYEQAVARVLALKQTRDTQIFQVQQSLADRLSALVKTLTMDNRIEEAMAVDRYLSRFKPTIAPPDAAPASPADRGSAAAAVPAGSRLRITFSGYNGPQPLRNFPALVVLGPHIPGFAYDGFASTRGWDLRFRDAADTRDLPYDIESWNPSGKSHVWVQVPEIAGNGTSIVATWGNRLHTQRPAYTADGSVWSEGFAGVWHLSETSGRHMDSSPNRNHSPKVYVTRQGSADGIVNGADELKGRGRRVVLPDMDFAANEATLSLWIRGAPEFDAGGEGWVGLLAYSKVVDPVGPKYRWAGLFTKRDQLRYSWGGDEHTWNAPLKLSPDTWNFVAVVIQPEQATLYLNDRSAVRTGPHTLQRFDQSLDVGVLPERQSDCRWVGDIDEIRISRQARSPGWMRACWLTAASNEAFTAYTME